jgi:Lamin Tail Domain
MKCWILLFLSGLLLPLRAAPQVSEFLAANHGADLDDFGESSDWIEIHNPDAAPLMLEGWALSDDEADLQKWKFPAVILPEGGFLVVRASGRDRRFPDQPLHTNFALSATGGFLGLTSPQGIPVSSWTAYPKQFSGVSYGQGAGGVVGYFTGPVPAAVNSVWTMSGTHSSACRPGSAPLPSRWT